jgi:hypothetical protein
MRQEELIEEYSALTRGEADLKREIFMIRIEYQVKEAVLVLNLPDSTVAMCLRAIADTYDSPKEKEES